ncbi:MAG: histidine phosphatase family protein [Alphaproteobacteria bacterium]
MQVLPGTTGRRRIYLMRHGHVDYFSPEVIASGDFEGVPLTALGRDQAKAAGQALAHVPFDRVICSGLNRTRQTAEITISNHELNPELNVEIERGLVELKGSTNGPPMTRDKLGAALAFQFDGAAEPGARFGLGTNGEVFADALARGSATLERLLQQPDWATILVVAHEGINRLILGWMTGAGLRGVQSFEQDTACVNILDFDMVPRADGQGVEITRKVIKALNLTPYNWSKFGMNMTSLERIMAPVDDHH